MAKIPEEVAIDSHMDECPECQKPGPFDLCREGVTLLVAYAQAQFDALQKQDGVKATITARSSR